MAEFFLGIDIGGTNIKVGLVNTNGSLVSKQKFSTSDLQESGDFVGKFVELVGSLLQQNPEVKRVGIGVPGTLSRKRRTTIDLPNLPELSHVKLHKILTTQFESVSFFLENDANAAALGEYHFSGQDMPEDFIFITLGTGIGSAAIINRKLFKGGRGNSMEMGHIMAGSGATLEQKIGKEGIVAMTTELLKAHPGKSTLQVNAEFDTDDVIDAARKGDPIAQEIFARVGTLLGEGLVSTIRILDVNAIFIGGGVSKVLDYVRPNMEKVMRQFLPPYYTDTMDIRLATLGNNAGIIGAASLCLEAEKEKD